MIKVVKRFRPDLYVSRGSPVSAHASRIFRKPHIAFIDSEYRGLSGIMSFGLNDVICTPSCFTRDLGKKQVRFDGYFELAYLHPNYFTPNSAVLDQLGLVRRDRFIVLRFVSWRASHDVGRSGIRNKIELVKELEKHGKVLISSESKLEKELEKYRIKIGPEYIHDLLYYAHMFFGDSQTMTTEAAILGTPAIRCNSFVGDKDMGNFLELEKKYGLIFNFRDIKDAVRKAGEILKKGNVKNEWESKKIALYNDKMDVVEFTVRLLEKYVKANGK